MGDVELWSVQDFKLVFIIPVESIISAIVEFRVIFHQINRQILTAIIVIFNNMTDKAILFDLDF